MRKILMILICTLLCSCSADFLDISASEKQSLCDTNNTTINHIESLNETDLLSKLPVPDPIQYTISLFRLPYSTADTTETDHAVEIGYTDWSEKYTIREIGIYEKIIIDFLYGDNIFIKLYP